MGWTLEEDTDSPGEADLSKIQTFTLPEGARNLPIERKRELVREMGGDSGQRKADYILAHTEELPTDCHFERLVFPATVWCDQRGDIYVPVLNNLNAFPEWMDPEQPETDSPRLRLSYMKIGRDDQRYFAHLLKRAEG